MRYKQTVTVVFCVLSWRYFAKNLIINVLCAVNIIKYLQYKCCLIMLLGDMVERIIKGNEHTSGV